MYNHKAYDLYEYKMLINAEGRCENYWLHGYVAMDTGSVQDDFFWAKRWLKERWEKQGEKVLDVIIEKNTGIVDTFDRTYERNFL